MSQNNEHSFGIIYLLFWNFNEKQSLGRGLPGHQFFYLCFVVYPGADQKLILKLRVAVQSIFQIVNIGAVECHKLGRHIKIAHIKISDQTLSGLVKFWVQSFIPFMKS